MSDCDLAVMIVPEIKEDSSGEYSGVVYWHTEQFIEHPPYRKIVKWIIGQLRQRYQVDVIDEPEEHEWEDFVFYDLKINQRKMRIYWENSLGYISFLSPHRDLIEATSVLLSGKKPEC